MKTDINAVLIGNTINVSINGKLYKKNCADKKFANALYKQILEVKENDSNDISEIICLINEKTRIAMACGLETDPTDGNVYLEGFNTPVPETLIDVFKEYHENKFPIKTILNFWKLLMLNPDLRIREKLFDFIKTHDFVLTDNGYMVVYKAVYYKVKDDNDLSEFIAKQYLHVKKDWSCSPNKYVVYTHLDDENYQITKAVTANNWDLEKKGIKILGNLNEMFKNIDKYIEETDTVYTDMYSQSMDIKLGQPVLKERMECDSNLAQECSYGLHVGATKYVQNYASWNNGDEKAILICYVNPANVVAVPDHDKSKIRVCEYFPFAIANYDNGEIEIIEQPYFESDYTTYEVEELEEMLKKALEDELPIETAINGMEEDRNMNELQNIISARLIDIVK